MKKSTYKIRVLIVDDNVETLTALKNIIKKHLPKLESTIKTAGCWREAEAIFKALSPNYAFIDYNLKTEENGIELIKFIKRKYKANTHWIVVSGCDEYTLTSAFHSDEAKIEYNFLQKPIGAAISSWFSNSIKKGKSDFSKLPEFIANPLLDYSNPSTTGLKKFHIAISLTEVIVTYLSAILCCYVDYDGDLLGEFTGKFVSLGNKIELLDKLLNAGIREDYSSNELLTSIFNKNLISYLKKINHIRNKYKAHSPTTHSDEKYIQILDEIKFDIFIDRMMELSFFNLLLVNESHYSEVDIGFNSSVISLSSHQKGFSIFTEAPLITGEIYLTAVDGSLYKLSPLFKYLHCEKCDKKQCFWFHNKINSTLEYSDLSGHLYKL